MRKRTDYIIVHCAATKASMDIGAKEIDQWHKERGFKMIGYHFVIRRNGDFEVGRELMEEGAHVTGYNHNSVGICLAGGLDAKGQPENNFTEEQFGQLHCILLFLREKFPTAKILGHNELNPGKACPSFSVQMWLKGKIGLKVSK